MTLPRAIIRKMDSIIFIFAHVFLLSFPHSLHSTKKFSCTTFSAFYFLYFYFFTWRDGDDDEGTEMRKNWNNFYITKHDVKYFPFLSLHCLLLFHFIICTIYTSCSSCSSQWEQAHVLSHPSILLVVSSLFFYCLKIFCSLFSTIWTTRMDEKIILHSMMRDYHDSFCYYLLSSSPSFLLLTNCSFITIHLCVSVRLSWH